jgi:hypothetical protein
MSSEYATTPRFRASSGKNLGGAAREDGPFSWVFDRGFGKNWFSAWFFCGHHVVKCVAKLVS